MDSVGDHQSWATREDVELGAVALCTPAPSSAKRRRMGCFTGNLETQPPRPDWAPEKHGKSRKELSAFGKRLICKVHDALTAILANDDSPLLKNTERPRANRRGAMGEIASQLFGVGQTTVSNCTAEASKRGGGFALLGCMRGKEERPKRDNDEKPGA